MSGDQKAIDARDCLHNLLIAAAAELGALGPEPLMVAGAPNKFNDADYDDYWCAVRVGADLWEQSQYFRSGYPQASARESSRLGWEDRGVAVGIGSAILASDRIAAGRRILNGLERADWRALVETGLRLDVIVALIVQFGETWLWVGNPQEPATIYLVHEGGIVRFAEEDGRMDDRIGDPDLILAERFHQDALLLLGPQARRRFEPEILDSAKCSALCGQALGAAKQVRAITKRPALLKIGEARRAKYRYDGHIPFGWNYPGVSLGGVRFNRQIQQEAARQQKAFVRSAGRSWHAPWTRGAPDARGTRDTRFAIANFPALLEIAEEVTNIGCRELFEAATGIDTFDRQDLRLLVTPLALHMVYRTHLFAISPSAELSHVGNLRSEIWHMEGEEFLERIAALDETMVTLVR